METKFGGTKSPKRVKFAEIPPHPLEDSKDSHVLRLHVSALILCLYDGTFVLVSVSTITCQVIALYQPTNNRSTELYHPLFDWDIGFARLFWLLFLFLSLILALLTWLSLAQLHFAVHRRIPRKVIPYIILKSFRTLLWSIGGGYTMWRNPKYWFLGLWLGAEFSTGILAVEMAIRIRQSLLDPELESGKKTTQFG